MMQVKHGNERFNCRHMIHNNNVGLACKRAYIYLIKTTPAPKKLSYRKKNSAKDRKKYTTRARKFTHCVRIKPRVALGVRCGCSCGCSGVSIPGSCRLCRGTRCCSSAIQIWLCTCTNNGYDFINRFIGAVNVKGIGCCFERRCFAMRINIIAMEQIGENSLFVGLGSRYNASGCNISACTLNSTAVGTRLRVCREENFNFGRRKHGSANVTPFGNNMLSLC